MSGSIKDRMQTQLQFNEKQIWNAFLHDGSDIIPYLSTNYFGDKDSVFILYDGTVLQGKKIVDFLESIGKIWMTYEMDGFEMIEIDMMAGVVYYGVVASRMENGKVVQYKLACSSTWRQNADAEYTISTHQETKLP